MIHLKFDNVEIHKHDVDTNSNYNVGITVYLDGEFFKGWHEKENVTDMELLKSTIKSIENKNYPTELDKALLNL